MAQRRGPTQERSPALPPGALRQNARLAELGRAGDNGAALHYSDPVYYDQAYGRRTHDVAYYVARASRARGPVLEYGVGNGRVALPLARAGIDVTGVDLSGAMLKALRQRLREEPPDVRARIRLKRGDMRRVRLGRRFALVLAPFNTLLHLYARRDVEQFLSRVREHLLPQGRFVFDFSLPRPEDLCLDPKRTFGTPPIRHRSTGERVRYRERFEYAPLSQVLLMHMEFSPESGAQGWSVPLTHRQFFPREIEALLHYNGFSGLRWTSDFTDEPAHAGSDSIVVECRVSARPGSGLAAP